MMYDLGTLDREDMSDAERWSVEDVPLTPGDAGYGSCPCPHCGEVGDCKPGCKLYKEKDPAWLDDLMMNGW